jgi:hypothetical protein
MFRTTESMGLNLMFEFEEEEKQQQNMKIDPMNPLSKSRLLRIENLNKIDFAIKNFENQI